MKLPCPLLCGGFLGFLGVLFVEALYTAGRVDKLLFARKKRMTFRADFEMDFRFRRPRFEGLATGAPYDRLNIVRMYVCFHHASREKVLYLFPFAFG